MAGFIKNAISGALAASPKTHSNLAPNSSPTPSEFTHTNNSTSSGKVIPAYSYTSVGVDDREHHAPPANKRINWFSRKRQDWWIEELLLILFSSISVVAIVIVLFVFDQKPLSKWLDDFSLNTYVAIFTTLAKGGIVYIVLECMGQLKWVWFAQRDAQPLVDFQKFDDASRGSLWSEIKLIVRLKAWHLGSLGALISILAFGLSPLTQQVIAYPNRNVVGQAATAALAPRSNFWAGYIASPIRNNYFGGRISNRMNQAITTAYWSSATDFMEDLTPSCGTGNCTWPLFETLAVCSKVVDVSEYLKVGTPKSGGPTQMNVTLPNGAVLEYGLYISNIESNYSMISDNSTTGLVISSYNIIYETTGTGWLLGEAKFNALEVVYHWCVNTYDTKISNGLHSTVVVDTTSNILEQDTEDVFSNYTIGRQGGSANNISLIAHGTLSMYLGNLFAGIYTAGAPGQLPGATNDFADLMHPVLTANTTALIQEGVTNYTGNMATSMTNSVRTNVGFSETSTIINVEGTTFITETYIHIRWPYLAPLIGLLFLSFLFLLGTIIQTSRAKVDAMKSNPLAAITVLGLETKNYMGPTALQEGTVRRAEGLSVRLVRDELGWHLNAER